MKKRNCLEIPVVLLVFLILGLIVHNAIGPTPLDQMTEEEERFIRVSDCYRVNDHEVYASSKSTMHHSFFVYLEVPKSFSLQKKEAQFDFLFSSSDSHVTIFNQLPNMTLEEAKKHLQKQDPSAQLVRLSDEFR